MFFTPSAAAPRKSDWRPMMFRSRQEMWATTSMPASSCTILAAATGCILRRARAPSEMSMASMPRSLSRFDASTTFEMSLPRGRSTSTATAKPVLSFSASSVEGPSGASCLSSSTAPTRTPRPGAASCGRKSRRASARALTCSGVVPQQPPTRRGEAGVREGGDGADLGGHALYDAHHPLRPDRAVRACKVHAQRRNLPRRACREAFRERLAVLYEGFVRDDRDPEPLDRLVGDAELDEVCEGLQHERVGAAFEEGLGLLQEHGAGLLFGYRADGTERTPEGAYGAEDQGLAPVRGPHALGGPAGEAGAGPVDGSHPAFELVGPPLESVGGEGVRLDHAGARPDVLLVDAGYHLGVGDVGAGVGVAEADAALREERAQRAVPDQDAGARPLPEIETQKKTSLLYVCASSRGREASRCGSDSSLGVSSAGVGTWHEALASPVAAASQGPSLHRSR